ncbi:MBL fold metallo-hydrolase [Bacillus salipaludis]|uniref:MBL fold metallo-hydrolase n=1 Tax=Bacillus salipaludis TaxID=2547811 RepID=A0A4R5VP72_9BACI|nr:MBL fold metallo-hydrolase [Bacillus salipaludis]MDQ6595748.1 MBL fold metallo-hydrolase [Bacillus salipaludis]TDK59913.1 MBL fold metallo-hydrolase [Bacillus salipaludis]
MIQFENEYITVFQSALFQTTCTVVDAKDFVLVVDPNWLPHEIEEIKQHVNGIKGEKELYLLFTHGDFDHVIGYKAFPGAKVIGSNGLRDHPNKEQKVSLIQQFYNENYIKAPYPIVFPEEIDIVIEEDGQKLVIGDTTITFYLSPGHTHDGLFTVIEPEGIWITGDYLSDFELPFIYDSAKAYEATLQKAEQILEKHNVAVMVPGHGQATTSQGEMKRRIQLSQDYLERLITAVKKEDQKAMGVLEKEMPFPSNFTKTCHKDNIAIIQREYK